MTQSPEKIKKISSLSFEDAMERLENTVRSMENGNVRLEEMIEKFEEGRLLASHCQKKLDSLKQKVLLLTRDGDSPEWQKINTQGIVESRNDFLPEEEEEEEEEEKPSSAIAGTRGQSVPASGDDLPF